MIRAVIDLGTNTFNLLVVEMQSEGYPKVLHRERRGVSLGMGGITKGLLHPDAMKRGMDCLTAYQAIAHQLNVEKIRAIGTSALRDAANAGEWIEEIRQELGIQIEIISGLEEARMIFNGVSMSKQLSDSGLIMDIGGGSTEFIHYNEGEIISETSLNIGLSRMYQLFKVSDPFTQHDIEVLFNFLEEQAIGKLDDIQAKALIGASGTFETFYELLHSEMSTDPFEAIQMNMNDFMAMIDQVIASTLEERSVNPQITEIRKQMAPFAALKVKWVMQKINFKEVWVSPCSLKEGALFL
jgi:exopolyphosphatase/guanosine-5'-triphosphate,3'-diphosphate pyrophosphatase